MLARTALRAAQLALALLAVAYLIYFADHARQLLTFSYPLDYGEGPLLAQVDQLRAGTPIWQLYRDPAAPPYLVINYPPLYLLLCAGLAQVTGSPLLAGRLTSLGSAIGAVMAIALLSGGAGGQRPTTSRPRDLGENYRLSAIGLSLLFLTVPIVREWASLMRVDMLGLCLGLWGLVVLGRPSGRRWPLLAGLLLLASLFTKPSLLAAPIAATSWLLWEYLRAPRGQRARPLGHLVALVAPIALGGGLLLGLLQAASGDWFTLHVVAANANRWDAELAQGFWQAQIALRWPLAAAALLALALAVRSRWAGTAPALLYTLAGCLTAAGVGKVGAYSNYFLELYAGLIWLVAAGGMGRKRESQDHPAHPMSRLLPIGACLLQIASLLYYAPLWDPTWPRQAGLVTPSPPRLALGRYGLWADARREADLLAAFGRVDQALDQEVRAAGQIFTDLPGTAAASGAVSRMQVFEARQLIDQGLSDQSGLLYDLANGEPPLAVIDYLGNWMPAQVVALLRHRYAQDGSLGTFDLYRPVDTGPQQTIDPPTEIGAGLALGSYALAAPLSPSYEPGELLIVNLGWQAGPSATTSALSVTLQLTTPEGAPLLESDLPLVYGALPPTRWPNGATVEHLQTLALPAELPTGRYGVAIGLRASGEPLGVSHQITTISVQATSGQSFEESGQFVPGPIMRAWNAQGGRERIGLPLTPAVPFAWGRLQCFELACLELRNGVVSARTLGAQLYLGETARSTACNDQATIGRICPGFATLTLRYGANLGQPISGEVLRNGWVVQWSEYARLERRPDTDTQGLGRLGEESLRLPPGGSYRWP